MAKLNAPSDFKKKVGAGQFFSPGSFKTLNKRGLAGALRALKYSNKDRLRNLSPKDIKTIHSLISTEITKIGRYDTLSRLAKRRIMGRAELMRRAGTLSSEDKKDLKDILDLLTEKERKTAQPSKELSPIIKAQIKSDIIEEAEQDLRGQSEIDYDPRSALGQFQQQNEPKNLSGQPKRIPPIELADQGRFKV